MFVGAMAISPGHNVWGLAVIYGYLFPLEEWNGATRSKSLCEADRGIIARYGQGEATPAGFGRQSGTWHSQGRKNGATPTTSCQNSSSGSTGWYWNELSYLVNLSFFGITKTFLTSWFFYFLSLMFSFLLDM